MRMLPFFPFVRSLYRRFKPIGVRHPLQDLKADERYPLIRLGTEYGGWTFVDDPGLDGATIVSGGLGEDASFDVEFARRYGATVIIADPTPRAISHFSEICSNFGKNRVRNYVHGGDQPVDAYDLRGIGASNFRLVPKALWNCRTSLKFFAPDNPRHVSHSIVNFNHDYSQNTKHIEVDSLTLSDLLEEFGLTDSQLRLLKLDIEGAEVEVICDLLDKGIRPHQILLEFDELNAPSPTGFERVDSTHEKLTKHGYKCIWTDGKADFLYIHAANPMNR